MMPADGLVPAPEALSRRVLLRGAAASAAVLAAAPSLFRTPPAAAAGGVFVATDPDLHLLRRATFGPTPALRAQVERLGRHAWIEQQLNPGSIDDSSFQRMLDRRFPGLGWTIPQARARLEEFSWDLMFDLGVAALARACWSKRQLFEVMVDFWSNHLNVTNPFDGGWDCRHDYDRRVIRKHALGRFEDMLIASAKHPAMLLYLNNAESSKYSPNENYGRELLELHTVGVSGGYDEIDMRQSALIMTGFTVDWETTTFQYEPSWHHTGRVSVMNWKSANRTGSGGYQVALDYLRYLAHHRSTARRIAYRLCERFVSDHPPAGLVDQLADEYLRSGTAIKPVLRKLFRSAAFANSVGEKVRRPMEDMAATVRILGIGPDRTGTDGMTGLYWMIGDLGHSPLGWVPPNGYPDTADAWRSAGGTLGRWNMHMSLAAHWWPDQLTLPNLRKNLLQKKLPRTHGALVDTLSRRLVFRELPGPHRAAILDFLGVRGSDPLPADSGVIQWELASLVSLILDTPSFTAR
ncbi:MAG TPA: DUF1800 domain-containing protein [Actinomycetota bacterium]|jgi:uncharacterized protein (DUF1800 family)